MEERQALAQVVRPLGEVEEIDLASRLLEVASAQELGRFLRGVVRRSGRKAGRALRASTVHALWPLLRETAGRLLPPVNVALGDAGGSIGLRRASGHASRAGRLLGLELEGLSLEDQELEVARRFVRLAGEAAALAALAQDRLRPERAAGTAMAQAVRRHAPGLTPSPALDGRRAGRFT